MKDIRNILEIVNKALKEGTFEEVTAIIHDKPAGLCLYLNLVAGSAYNKYFPLPGIRKSTLFKYWLTCNAPLQDDGYIYPSYTHWNKRFEILRGFRSYLEDILSAIKGENAMQDTLEVVEEGLKKADIEELTFECAGLCSYLRSITKQRFYHSNIPHTIFTTWLKLRGYLKPGEVYIAVPLVDWNFRLKVLEEFKEYLIQEIKEEDNS